MTAKLAIEISKWLGVAVATTSAFGLPNGNIILTFYFKIYYANKNVLQLILCVLCMPLHHTHMHSSRYSMHLTFILEYLL